MKVPHPPAVATWLLEYVGSNQTREALAGDLVEQYGHGRSVGWYWRQVIAAIIVGNSKDIWEHKVLALRAILLGWAGSYVLDKVLGVAMIALLPSSMGRLEVRPDHPFMSVMLSSLFLIGIVHNAVVQASTGWLVARFHRPYQTAMVLAFLASFLLLDLPWLYRRWADAFAIGTPLLFVMFARQLVAVIVTVASVLAGGLWSGMRTNDTDAVALA
jgi:hypothetical protein